jgi:hypothetical protein
MVFWQEELESGKRNSDHEKQYAKYFEVKSTLVRGTKGSAKEDALAQAKKITVISSLSAMRKRTR